MILLSTLNRNVVYYSDSDSNMIVLAHKYFGSSDADLKSFIQLNELKIDEYLQIKQGRLIKWLA